MSQSTNPNIDMERDAYHDGYPALARFIAQDPDHETFIFRRFDSLAALNLLYLQAEVFEIRRNIINLQKSIVDRLDKDLIESMRRWETHTENVHNSPQRPEREMNDLLVVLRARLKEYHEALVLQAEIAKLGRPRGRGLRFFRRWFDGKSRDLAKKAPCTIIAGEARFMLEDEDDLAALKVPPEDDHLSRLLRDYWPLIGEPGRHSKDDTRYFRLRHVNQTVAVVSTLVAAVELVGAITSLYFVTNRDARIGLIALFTSLFGFSLCLLTSARRGEIFGASAAYAAVLVVFVSGDLATPVTASASLPHMSRTASLMVSDLPF